MEKIKKWICLTLVFVCGALGLCVLSGCKKTAKVYTRYEITAEYAPESRTLTGAVKVTFENCGNGEISVLKFQMYPNAYRKDALYKPVSTAYADAAYYAGEYRNCRSKHDDNSSRSCRLRKNRICKLLCYVCSRKSV